MYTYGFLYAISLPTSTTVSSASQEVFLYRNYLPGHMINVLYMGSKILSLIGQQIVYANFDGCDGWQTEDEQNPPRFRLDLRFRIGYSHRAA